MSGRVFALSNGTYGSPRMTRELRDGGLTVSRHRIARLMRENGLRARQKRRFKRTTDSHHAWPVAANLLDQDFTATGPDKKWGDCKLFCFTCWSYMTRLLKTPIIGRSAKTVASSRIDMLAGLSTVYIFRMPPAF
jgi:transposase InsO family protein